MHVRFATIFLLSTYCTSLWASALTWDGFGEVKFGTSLEQHNSDTENILLPLYEEREEGCYYVSTKNDNAIRYMIENGVITRAEVPVDTPNSVSIDTFTELEELKIQFPEMIVKNHKYAIGGHYLIFYNRQKTRAILLEHYESKIQQLRAGLVPSVLYVEGCL